MNSLTRIRRYCLAKPGAIEDEPWPGDTVWKVKGKIFAMGGKTAVTVKSTPEKQSALILHPNVEKAAYVGRFGWVTVKMESKDDLEFALELIDESYDMISNPKKSKKRKPL